MNRVPQNCVIDKQKTYIGWSVQLHYFLCVQWSQCSPFQTRIIIIIPSSQPPVPPIKVEGTNDNQILKMKNHFSKLRKADDNKMCDFMDAHNKFDMNSKSYYPSISLLKGSSHLNFFYNLLFQYWK
jgi:hypothetical protein